MSLIETIIETINYNKKDMYTIVKYDISNGCCTSQADNDFEMTIQRLSYNDAIRYLFKDISPRLSDEYDNDDDDEYINRIANGFICIMNKKRVSIFDECDCGLEFFIFKDNEYESIKVKNNDFHDEKYSYNNYFYG